MLLNSDWTNPNNPRDGSGDGVVVPLDVLNLINELNNPTVISSNGQLPTLDGAPPFFFDVNGDGFATSNDVLVIINALNDDNAAPTLAISLENDTAPGGSTNDDLVSQEVVFVGTASDNLTGISSLEVRVASDAAQRVLVSADGTFAFDPRFALDGSDDGSHTAQFTAIDGVGNRAEAIELVFTLDTTEPTLTVSAPTDGGTLSAGGSLQGVVSGTGSSLDVFEYSFDGGAKLSLPAGVGG